MELGDSSRTDLFVPWWLGVREGQAAVCPGLTRPTQAQPAMGARPVAQSAAGLVWAATLPGDGRAVGSSAMDSLWTAAARDALRHRHGASIRWPHHESIA